MPSAGKVVRSGLRGPPESVGYTRLGTAARSASRSSEASFLESQVHAQRPADARPRDGRLGPAVHVARPATTVPTQAIRLRAQFLTNVSGRHRRLGRPAGPEADRQRERSVDIHGDRAAFPGPNVDVLAGHRNGGRGEGRPPGARPSTQYKVETAPDNSWLGLAPHRPAADHHHRRLHLLHDAAGPGHQ